MKDPVAKAAYDRARYARLAADPEWKRSKVEREKQRPRYQAKPWRGQSGRTWDEYLAQRRADAVIRAEERAKERSERRAARAAERAALRLLRPPRRRVRRPRPIARRAAPVGPPKPPWIPQVVSEWHPSLGRYSYSSGSVSLRSLGLR